MKTVNVCPEMNFDFDETVCCIGNFDGVHLGHQQLINKVVEYGNKHNIAKAIITFDPDPITVFNPDKSHKHLTTLEQRLKYFEEYGLDVAYVIRFDEELCHYSADEFISLLNRMNIVHLVCGFDYTFGFKGQGNAEYLINSNLKKFSVEVVDCVNHDGKKISSSTIIPLIEKGKISEAVRMLGHSYRIDGKWTGMSLINSHNALPDHGVYVGKLNGSTRIIEINSFNLRINGVSEDVNDLELLKEL